MKQKALLVLSVLGTAALMTACGNRYDDNDHAVRIPETTRINETTVRVTDDNRGVGDAAGDMVSDVVDDGANIVSDVVEGGRDVISEAGDAIDDAVNDADNDVRDMDDNLNDNDGNYRTNHRGRTDTTD